MGSFLSTIQSAIQGDEQSSRSELSRRIDVIDTKITELYESVAAIERDRAALSEDDHLQHAKLNRKLSKHEKRILALEARQTMLMRKLNIPTGGSDKNAVRCTFRDYNTDDLASKMEAWDTYRINYTKHKECAARVVFINAVVEGAQTYLDLSADERTKTLDALADSLAIWKEKETAATTQAEVRHAKDAIAIVKKLKRLVTYANFINSTDPKITDYNKRVFRRNFDREMDVLVSFNNARILQCNQRKVELDQSMQAVDWRVVAERIRLCGGAGDATGTTNQCATDMSLIEAVWPQLHKKYTRRLRCLTSPAGRIPQK